MSYGYAYELINKFDKFDKYSINNNIIKLNGRQSNISNCISWMNINTYIKSKSKTYRI